MENIIPISWSNQILLLLSILSASLCLIIQEWIGLTPLPIYVSLSWSVFVMVISIWISCFLLRLTLKTNRPINLKFLNKWAYKWLERNLHSKDKLKFSESSENNIVVALKDITEKQENICTDQSSTKNRVNTENINTQNSDGNINFIKDNQDIALGNGKLLNIDGIVKEIRSKCIETWYKSISQDETFPNEAQELLQKLLIKVFQKTVLIDKIKLTSKLADTLVLHLKEYRRALKRVDKGSAVNIEEAYKCLHPASRSNAALEHMLHRLVTILAQEFLQWELTSSLPCKLLLSIVAKRLFVMIQTASQPNWIFANLLQLLEAVPKKPEIPPQQNGTVFVALSGGITSATAAVIPRPLPKTVPDPNPSTRPIHSTDSLTITLEKPTLCLEGLPTEHRGLWNDISISEGDLDLDEDRVSPVYEEPTDFATTIARLRSLLQQKSTATTPMHTEEKTYTVYEGCQFTNLSIPWTEFHTASDGSQQLLYCIQFDDVEQRGEDLFETTTATVRRQYSDFAQLHASLESVPSLSGLMSDLTLPKGGRVEMETYLRTLCIRLGSECVPQLRHFLRPSSGMGKKADSVTPRFDRFLAKTVSGVFNTLRTVVPGFEIEQEEEVLPLPTLMPLADVPWRFVEDVKSMNLASGLQQLIAERTDYCSAVDTAYEAYEAVDPFEGSDDPESLTHWWETVNSSYDEEVDDLDSNLTLTCTAIDLICELLTGIDSNNALQQEAVVRWTKLLFGNITEPALQVLTLSIFEHMSNASFTCDVQTDPLENTMVTTKDKIYDILQKKIPYSVKLLFGEHDTQKILKYLLESREVKKINLDLNLQLLEVLASQLLISCKTHCDKFSP